MKKMITIVTMALIGVFCHAATTTNAVDVYDMKVSIKTPVVKLAKATYNTAAYVYRDTEDRILKGYLTLTWVKEDGDDFETVIPSLTLRDSKIQDSDVDYAIISSDVAELGITPFDVSILGKKMTKSSATFIGVNNAVTPDVSGYKFLAFSGFGTTASYKTAIPVCGQCGIMTTTNGKCIRISTISGKVVGMYCCGCADDSPSAAAQSCGYVTSVAGATPFVGCNGTWTAKYNKKLSR